MTYAKPSPMQRRLNELKSGRLQDDVPSEPSSNAMEGGPDPAPNMFASVDKSAPNALGMERRREKMQQMKDSAYKRGGAVSGGKPKARMDKKPRGGTKNWMAGAVKHPGAMTAAAKREGVSNSAYEQEHKGDAGLAGKRARLALTFKKSKH